MVIEYPYPGMPGDVVRFRIGYDGCEPDLIRQRAKQWPSSHLRCAVALNTYYDEIHNNYYVNKALLGIIQQCLHDLGLFVVVADSYQPDGFVPAEPPGTLIENEDYYLVTKDHDRLGGQYLWHFGAGGYTSFYASQLIMDIILPELLIYHLSSQLDSCCRRYDIGYEEFPSED